MLIIVVITEYNILHLSFVNKTKVNVDFFVYLLTSHSNNMARRMQVQRLGKDELEYELKVRGISVGTCEIMRHNLAMAIRLEKSGDSFKYPKYPFTFTEDYAAVVSKLDETETWLKNFEPQPSESALKKLETRLAHIMNRLDNMEVKETEEQENKSVLVARALALMASLASFKEDREKGLGSVPLSVGVLATDTQASFDEDLARAMGSSVLEERERSPRNVDTAAIKPIHPSKWGLTFSGDKKSLSINAFLEKVEELRVARNVSEAVLLDSGIDLFTGRAYQFYLTCRKEVKSWEGLVQMFREEYQPPDYNEKLFEEIKRRTQGPEESIGIYLALMAGYFKRLTCPISEEVKLKILLRNIAPFYQRQLCLVEVTSISHLRDLCRKIEAKREAVENFSAPPTRRAHVLEPDLAYVGVEGVSNEEVMRMDVPPTTSAGVVCFRCNQPGHRAIGCAMRKKICFKCKAEGYTVRTCPKCSTSGNEERRS